MLLVVIFALLVASSAEERTVFGKLKSGFQLAGKLLGIDQANGVAQLVSEAFGKAQPKGDGSEATSNIFSGFLRILGFDSKRIGAIAINTIIFVAQLISSSLTRNSQITHARSLRDGTPLDWMMSSPQVISMFEHIKDKNLPDHIIMYIKERALDEDTDCIQLLICKGAPFVWGMQKVLASNSSTVSGTKSLYFYLPTLDEVIDHADLCDKKHPYCFVHI